jgi:hypothetical protein
VKLDEEKSKHDRLAHEIVLAQHKQSLLWWLLKGIVHLQKNNNKYDLSAAQCF